MVQSNGQFGDNGLTVTTPNGLHKEKSPILRVLRNMVKSSDSRDTANSEHVTTDSGKGESEHESLSSHHQVTNNNYRYAPIKIQISKKNSILRQKSILTRLKYQFSIQQTIQESRFGPNCVSECSMNGHSDQCWLIEFPRHFPRTQRSLDYHRSQGLIHFTTLKLTTHNSNHTRSTTPEVTGPRGTTLRIRDCAKYFKSTVKSTVN